MVGYGLMALSTTAVLVFATPLELWVCWAIGVNTTVLIAFSFDKSAAIRNQWRIPEVVLHTLAAAGGSPMAWIARALFNHKTTKEGFGRTLVIITAIQLAAGLGLAYYLSRA
jgi:uncharacterized membrane protein YsdA (DUF1294 family)